MSITDTQRVSSGAGRAFRVVVSQPNWVVRSVLLTIVAVLFVTLLIVVLPAIVVGVALFLVLALFGAARTFVRGLFSGRGAARVDGRENVRIIRREG